jgi:hypothetical protein
MQNMNEFSNRLEAQRRVLTIVNGREQREQLCGLSANALERWLHENGLQASDPVPTLLRTISERLFFLATKSQEQVSEEYASLATQVDSLTRELTRMIG